RRDSDFERYLRAENDSRENVAPERVGAERKLPRWRPWVAEAAGHRAGWIMRRENRREQRDEDQARHHRCADDFHRVGARLQPISSSRIRGSRKAYIRSTMRFAITIRNAEKSTVPMMSGMSRLKIAS